MGIFSLDSGILGLNGLRWAGKVKQMHSTKMRIYKQEGGGQVAGAAGGRRQLSLSLTTSAQSPLHAKSLDAVRVFLDVWSGSLTDNVQDNRRNMFIFQHFSVVDKTIPTKCPLSLALVLSSTSRCPHQQTEFVKLPLAVRCSNLPDLSSALTWQFIADNHSQLQVQSFWQNHNGPHELPVPRSRMNGEAYVSYVRRLLYTKGFTHLNISV